MIEFLAGLMVIIGVGYFIFKSYSPTGVLLCSGLILLLLTALLGHPVLPAKVTSTGNQYLDIFEFVKYMLMYRGGGLGMLIMVLVGFATYMTKIKANDMVVKMASKPLQLIKSPYILMVSAYFIACLMSMAVSSAAGLGVLLMASLFPLMVNMGISRGAATAICASPAAIILSPTSGDVVIAAQSANMELVDFAFKTAMPTSILAICSMAAAHYFWQRYLDAREQAEMVRVDASQLEVDAPVYYCLLPFLPIAGVILFSGKLLPKLHIVTILLMCLTLVAIIELIRHRNGKMVLESLEAVYQGMANAFATVVILLVAAGVFAQGLISIGFINYLLGFAETGGFGALSVLLLLVGITAIAAFTTGSGNAPFYAFVELIPSLAAKMGINPAYLIVPMLQASNLGRTVSPVSGVVVATSGMAKISPFETVKRTSVPVLVGMIVVIITTQLWIPK